jgi:WD40 repeat protein
VDGGIIKVMDVRNSGVFFENQPKKVIHSPEMGTAHYIALEFFIKEDYKYLAAITNNNRLVVFDWDKQKIKGTIELNFLHRTSSMFFNPFDKSMLCVYGHSITKKAPFQLVQCKVENGNIPLILKNDLFKDFVKNYNFHILSHATLNNIHYHFVFGTLEGELLFVNRSYELKIKLNISPDPSRSMKIEHILSVKNGFAVAGSSAKVMFFEKKKTPNAKTQYFLSKNKIELQKYIYNSVNNFILLNDDTFLIGLSSGELLQATLLSNKSDNGSHYKIEPCILHFHNKKINSIAICERKSIFVTCSSDNTVIVFNYMGRANTAT